MLGAAAPIKSGYKFTYAVTAGTPVTQPAGETLEKFARGLEIPMYQLFYDGEEPPKLPKVSNLRKRKSADDIAWGSTGKDARWLAKFRRMLARTKESDRTLLMFMVQKMARLQAA